MNRRNTPTMTRFDDVGPQAIYRGGLAASQLKSTILHATAATSLTPPTEGRLIKVMSTARRLPDIGQRIFL